LNHFKLAEMHKGWFVGNFSPSAIKTVAFEIAVKTYQSGDREDAHFHLIATEITLVQSGKVEMAGKQWDAGDIIVLAPGEITDFTALTDAVTVVVKMPCVSNDKYLV